MPKIEESTANSPTLLKNHLITYEEAQEIYNAGPEIVIKVILYLSAEINELQKKVTSLEAAIAKLSKNSSNSSKPPSSDDITKPRKKKRKKR